MDNGSEGYTTELTFTADYCREQVPNFLGFVSLLAGVDVSIWGEKPIRYLDLGCGIGITANIIAAANPKIDVVALDHNPTHIAAAQGLAEAADISNVRFLEKSFEEARDDLSLGSFDVISMRGVFSWVPANIRDQIVELIRKKLRTGGIVYVSYISYPGCAEMVPVQRLLAEVAKAEPGLPVADRLNKGLDLVARLQEVGALYLKLHPYVGISLEKLRKIMSPHYLFHEYLAGVWEPLSFSDVAYALSPAKLDFVGSTNLLKYLDAFNLTGEQQALLKGIKNKNQRQLIRDFFLNRVFREDIFARGPLPISPSKIKERWLKTRFALIKRRDDIPLKVKGNLGYISLPQQFYEPVIAMLERKPQTVGDLLLDDTVSSIGEGRLQQVLTVLVGQSACVPALPEAGDGERRRCTDQLNKVLLERAATNAEIKYLASPVTGGGVPVDLVTQLMLVASQKKVDDIPQFVNKVLSHRGSLKEVEAASPDGRLEVIKNCFHTFNDSCQFLAKLGIC